MTHDYTLLDRIAEEADCPFRKDEPMALHTTFRIGGPADRFITVKTVSQLLKILDAFKQGGTPWLMLGNGSDLLVSDDGIRGAVICLEGEFKQIQLLADGCTLRAGAAASLASVCSFARDHALTGLEFAWGIPGSVGGAVYMNAGAYGGEMKDVVKKVCYAAFPGSMEEAMGEELGFSYRKSRYTGKRDVILFAEYGLARGNQMEISREMEELMSRRKEKQPYDMPSAGSVFKRPQKGYAAALIEQCGLKGERIGGAQISPKHAGFIVNTGGATCADVLSLMEKIQKTVERETGILLEPEIRVTGENGALPSSNM